MARGAIRPTNRTMVVGIVSQEGRHVGKPLTLGGLDRFIVACEAEAHERPQQHFGKRAAVSGVTCCAGFVALDGAMHVRGPGKEIPDLLVLMTREAKLPRGFAQLRRVVRCMRVMTRRAGPGQNRLMGVTHGLQSRSDLMMAQVAEVLIASGQQLWAP